jgi:hypothetical protein
VSGVPNQVRDDEVPIPCLRVTSLGLLPVLLLILIRLPTVTMKFPFDASHIVLLWFHVMVILRFLPCNPAFVAFAPPSPFLLFTLNLPHRQATAADALSEQYRFASSPSSWLGSLTDLKQPVPASLAHGCASWHGFKHLEVGRHFSVMLQNKSGKMTEGNPVQYLQTMYHSP